MPHDDLPALPTLLAIALACAAPLRAPARSAAAPVKHVDIYVTPYYEAARGGGAPKVEVGKQYDALLASTRREDVVRARDEIARNNALVTPMTLMVLAIRLYDVGLRDDAVFWFYAAKDRFVTLADRVRHQLAAARAGRGCREEFRDPRGPDDQRLRVLRHRPPAGDPGEGAASGWSTIRTRRMFLPQVPARPGDRDANLQARRSLEITAAAAKEREYLAKPANVAELKAKRKENDADGKFCWK